MVWGGGEVIFAFNKFSFPFYFNFSFRFSFIPLERVNYICSSFLLPWGWFDFLVCTLPPGLMEAAGLEWGNSRLIC